MSIYEDLGIKPIINASATLTKLGGSRMPQEVLEAMRAAAGSFVDLPLFQTRIGDRIAELTQNDAAFVSSGAAGGIVLAVATLLAAPNEPDPMAYPMLKGITKNEVIVFTSQRNGYDFAILQTGASIVECDDTLESFESAITERTACLVWFTGALAVKSPPIEDVIAIARKHHVPVLVDAAAQILPVSSLWHYTKILGCGDPAQRHIRRGRRGCWGLRLGTERVHLHEIDIAQGRADSSVDKPLLPALENQCEFLMGIHRHEFIESQDALG